MIVIIILLCLQNPKYAHSLEAHRVQRHARMSIILLDMTWIRKNVGDFCTAWCVWSHYCSHFFSMFYCHALLGFVL